MEPPVDNYKECGSCGGRGYVPDEPEKPRRVNGEWIEASRPCRDCGGEGWVPVSSTIKEQGS